MPALSRVIIAGFIALIATGFVTGSVATAAAPGELAFPAPIGTQWEVLSGYNTPTHQGVDPYALDLWRIDAETGGTPLLSPMSGTLGYMSDTCISVRTPEVNLLMCHVHALPGLQRGDTITVGQRLGTVANDGEAENGGTAHIHLQLNARGDQGTGESLPFTGAYDQQPVTLVIDVVCACSRDHPAPSSRSILSLRVDPRSGPSEAKSSPINARSSSSESNGS